MSKAPKSPYQLRVARPAARAIANELPEAVAAAVVELITGDLLRAPRTVGKPLQRELEGRCIDEEAGVVTVLAAEHRRDVYRRR